MTREHKLALIIGFSIVLLVGVLVSDHLSRARFDALDPVGAAPGEDGGGLVALAPPKPLDTRGSAARSTPGPRIVEPERVVDLWTADPMDHPSGESATQLASAEIETPESLAAEAQATEFQTAEVRLDEGPLFTLTQRTPEPQPEPAPTTRDGIPILSAQQIAQRLGVSDMPVAATVTNAPHRGELPTAPRKTVTHRVAQGDTLFRLAERYWGDGHLWPQLAAANRDRIGPDNTLRIGATLVIPAAQGSSRPAAQQPVLASAQPKADSKTDTKPATKAPAKASTYTVKPGDTLGEIAQRTLGSVRYTDRIVAANDLDDADDIRVGMVLKIPSV